MPTVQIYALTNLLANTAGGGASGAVGPGVNFTDPTTVGCVWDSYYNGGVNDYFNQNGTGPADSAVSPDGKYFATIGYGNNEIRVVSLTNGIPDVSTLYVVANTVSTVSAGRGLCWDAADNVYLSSSGGATYQEWTLGFTATAVTTGNASGATGFSLVLPSISVGVVASNSISSTIISQQNTYGNPTNATFVISRSGSTASALTVFFTLGGTASNTTYTASKTTSITLQPGISSTNVTITAITDGIARPTTTIVMTLSESGTYSVSPATATLTYLNTAPDKLVASVGAPTMYNAFSNDFASITITRWGDTNAATITASSFTTPGGTAVAGVDYTLPTAVTFNPGDLTQTSYIYPLHNGQLPVDSSANPYVGNKTAIIGIGSGSGYTPATNTALLTILDSANPTTTVLWADPLTDPNDATNWGVTAANNNMQTTPIDTSIAGTSESSVIFGYDLQNGDPGDFGAVPLPPSGAATALRVTANKSAGASAGVNLYPTNHNFSGNYAVRFSMNIVQGDNNTISTEGPLVGINHSGTETNWWTGSALVSGWGTPPTENWESDGVWYWINADNDNGSGAYLEFTGLGGVLPNTGWQEPATATAGTFANPFNTNVFSGGIYWGPGLVSSASILNGNVLMNGTSVNPANNWADVEIKQINNIVTLSIDKTPVFVYTNATVFTNGTLMLGYDDPFSSVGAPDGAVYFSNLRVVSLAAPVISQIAVNKVNNTVVINFTTDDGDLIASSFALQSAAGVNGPYADNAGATIVPLSAGAFQAVVPQSGSVQFYRVHIK